MGLKRNLEYWKISLENPEPLIDDYYNIFNKVIVKDEELIRNVKRLRELIERYCTAQENREDVKGLLDEIQQILKSTDKIQYTEFVAFWKVLDISFSEFKKLPNQNQKYILSKLLKEYCLHRIKLYEELGYSNITTQALYDSGASRKKGEAGIVKVLHLAREVLNLNDKLNAIDTIEISQKGYFLPNENKEFFSEFCKTFNIIYEFGRKHQGKKPDIILKVNNHFFIIEAKHIKETGGGQDKQIYEIIEFIKYSENSNFIHYLSFMDGTYFNKFIRANFKSKSKINKQKRDIERYLKNNPNNFFVNTAGLKEIFKDLLKMRLIFLGPPGAGKGTQAEIISKKLNLRKISTGDILREEMEKGTELGKIAKSYMEKGELVPDQIMIKIIENNIKNLDGFILDGFPRTLNQAIELEKITEIDKVIYLNVPDDEIKKRLLNRGRLDDKPEVIENRIKIYREQTQPLIEFYKEKGILYEINGIGTIEEITKRIEEVLYER